jgi:hypothetical protein
MGTSKQPRAHDTACLANVQSVTTCVCCLLPAAAATATAAVAAAAAAAAAAAPPPATHTDASKEGLRFFSFSLNELGIHDIPAQLDHLHTGEFFCVWGGGGGVGSYVGVSDQGGSVVLT